MSCHVDMGMMGELICLSTIADISMHQPHLSVGLNDFLVIYCSIKAYQTVIDGTYQSNEILIQIL